MRPIFRSTGLLALLALLAACGTAGPAAAPTANMPAGATMQLVIAASELVVGANRFPVGLVVRGTPSNDQQIGIRLTFRPVQDPAAAPIEADALYRGQGLPVGIYVAEPSFPQPGDWTVTALVKRGDEQTFLTPMRFSVLEKGATPAVGSPAIASKSKTLKDVPDITQLTSDIEPDPELYQLSIADALAAKKPFLVAFSTPGYCKTAMCGPNIKVIKQLKGQFRDKINFIHVEVYPYPFSDSVAAGTLVDAMQEWRLETEPWAFVVDGSGTIKAKYEGGITLAELEPELKQVAGS
ncbi:MAG: thioredoxin family protein [Chloroflexales bacterium]|nr:thioredoxin family protein [Chloroflexales bacterium]